MNETAGVVDITILGAVPGIVRSGETGRTRAEDGDVDDPGGFVHARNANGVSRAGS